MTTIRIILIACCLWATQAGAGVLVRDAEGNELALNQPAQRIISLAPNITELLFAAGGAHHVVGVMQFSDFPEAAKKIAVIGDSHELDMERILALHPDLLVVWRGGGSGKQISQLQKLHIPVFYIDLRKMDDIPRTVMLLGQLMGTELQANATAAGLQQQLTLLSGTYAHRTPVRIFYQVWDKPLFTLNGQHIVSDAIRLCGGVNIFAGLANLSPNVDIEAVLQEDPDAIVGTTESNPADGGVTMWNRYPALRAVRHGHIVTIDGNLMNRAGPRMIAGTAALCEKLDSVRKKTP